MVCFQYGFPAISLAEAAQYANVVGAAVALVAAITAYVTFKHNSAASNRSHMHSLFREYLTVRINTPRVKPQADGLAQDLIGFKLYVLEEIYIWAKAAHSSRICQIGRRLRIGRVCCIGRIQDDELKGWVNTIAHHILEEPSETLEYVKAKVARRKDIFDASFLAFVCAVLETCGPQTDIAGKPSLDETSRKFLDLVTCEPDE